MTGLLGVGSRTVKPLFGCRLGSEKRIPKNNGIIRTQIPQLDIMNTPQDSNREPSAAQFAARINRLRDDLFAVEDELHDLIRTTPADSPEAPILRERNEKLKAMKLFLAE